MLRIKTFAYFKFFKTISSLPLSFTGVVTYLGAFTVDFRNDLIGQWKSLSSSINIPFTSSFSMITTLGDAVKIRSWNINGLPVDNYSIENGIILFTSNKWPLLIDPQGNGNLFTLEPQKHYVRVGNNTAMAFRW